MAAKVTKKPQVEKKEDIKKDKRGKKEPKTNIEDVAPDPFKLSILCLHGFRTSAKIMAEQVTLAHWSPLMEDIAELVNFHEGLKQDHIEDDQPCVTYCRVKDGLHATTDFHRFQSYLKMIAECVRVCD